MSKEKRNTAEIGYTEEGEGAPPHDPAASPARGRSGFGRRRLAAVPAGAPSAAADDGWAAGGPDSGHLFSVEMGQPPEVISVVDYLDRALADEEAAETRSAPAPPGTVLKSGRTTLLRAVK